MPKRILSLSKTTKVALAIMGKAIKAARLERGISQQDLAERLNVSRTTVIFVEKGSAKVAIGTVFEAAYILGIPLLEDDFKELEKAGARLSSFVNVLPQRIRKKKDDLSDDF